MSDQVLYADAEVSVHQPYGSVFKDHFGNEKVNVRSVTLLPGQYVDLDTIADYERERAENEGLPGARVLSKNDAELLADNEVRKRDAEVEGVDNSHSDWLVTDEVRRENHVAMAEDVAGAGEVEDESSVAQGDNAMAQPYLQSQVESPVDASNKEAATEVDFESEALFVNEAGSDVEVVEDRATKRDRKTEAKSGEVTE